METFWNTVGNATLKNKTFFCLFFIAHSQCESVLFNLFLLPILLIHPSCTWKQNLYKCLSLRIYCVLNVQDHLVRSTHFLNNTSQVLTLHISLITINSIELRRGLT